jgi:hypothetical protein
MNSGLFVILLKMPPILLGLSIVLPEGDNAERVLEVEGTAKVIDATTIDIYDNVLKLSWELYYTSSAQWQRAI